jgi:hypothetical protein
MRANSGGVLSIESIVAKIISSILIRLIPPPSGKG